MHDVFYISLLRLYKRQGEDKNNDNVPPAFLPRGETEHEVDMIIGHEDDADHERFYKVKWQRTSDLSWGARNAFAKLQNQNKGIL